MLTLTQLQTISQSKYVIFSKTGCPFCVASTKLLQTLKDSGKIGGFDVYTLDVDFDNETLGELSIWAGWKPDGGQSYPSKPQIFMKGEYIGGNFDFYKSNWNIGANMPNLNNSMRF